MNKEEKKVEDKIEKEIEIKKASSTEVEEKVEHKPEEKKEKKERTGIVYIYTSFNNTIVHFTDMAGNTIVKYSSIGIWIPNKNLEKK